MPASTKASYVGRFAPPGYPNTTSTPSALRHSITASTARMRLTSFRKRSEFLVVNCDEPPRGTARGTASLSWDRAALRRRDRRQDLGLVGEVELGSAAGADGVVHHADVSAGRTAAARLVGVEPVEQRGGQADEREDARDHGPEEERAALQPADETAGQREGERDDEVDHRRARSEHAEGPDHRGEAEDDHDDRRETGDEADDELEQDPSGDGQDHQRQETLEQRGLPSVFHALQRPGGRGSSRETRGRRTPSVVSQS